MNHKIEFLILIFILFNVCSCINDESKEENDPLAKGKVVKLQVLYSLLPTEIIGMVESNTGDAYEIDRKNYDKEELKKYLERLDKDKLKFGILIWGSKLYIRDACYPYPIVENFCIDNDVDLFSRGCISRYVQPEEDFAYWKVQSSNTIYALTH